LLNLFVRALARLPLPVLYGLAWPVYFVVYRVLRARRRVVEANLRRSFPDLGDEAITQLSRRVYRNFADVLVEMLCSLHLPEEQFRTRVEISGDDAVRTDLEGGRPVLLLMAHQCNIEWLLLGACLRFRQPVEAVYRPLANLTMEKLMREAYTRFGGRIIEDRSVVRSIARRRSEPRIVTLISDQLPNVKDDSYWTTFLNQETGFFMAPGNIARFTGYPVYFAAMKRRRRGHYDVAFRRIAEPPYADAGVVMRAYVRAVEEQILAAPEDWFWMHRRWKRKRVMYQKTTVAGEEHVAT